MSINPFRAKISKQPSSYPSTLFHLIRIGQFVSATIVLSILSFFAHFLIAERFHVPWTFLLVSNSLTFRWPFQLSNTRLAPGGLGSHHLGSDGH